MAKQNKDEAVDAAVINCHYEKESKRFKRYSIDENDAGIVGTVYVPKEKAAPEQITVTFDK